MERLTNEQIEAIRERAEKATEGPWTIRNKYGDISGSDGNDVIYAYNSGDDMGCVAITENNEEFVLNARQDIPALLAEVERLNAQLSELVCGIYEHLPSGHALHDLAEVIDHD